MFLELSHVSGIPELLSAQYKEPKVLVDERLFPGVNHCGIISVIPRCSAEISHVWTQPFSSTPLGWVGVRQVPGRPCSEWELWGGHNLAPSRGGH